MSSNTTEGAGDWESQKTDALKILKGRVTTEVYVVNGRTGESRLMASYDFDVRDSIELVFINGDDVVSGKSVEEIRDENTFLFNFQKQPGDEVENLKNSNRKNPTVEQLDAEFAEALREMEPVIPTVEDYMRNVDVQLGDLSVADQLAVLHHDIDLLKDSLVLYGEKPASSKPGFMKRVFTKS